MNLVYAILADAAQITPDGKFSIFGGGIEILTAPSFPALTPMITLLIRLGVRPNEVGREHRLEIELRTPTGENMLPAAPPAQFTPRPGPPGVLSPLTYLFAVNLPGLVFRTPGTHTFRLIVDGRLVGEVNIILRTPAENEQPQER